MEWEKEREGEEQEGEATTAVIATIRGGEERRSGNVGDLTGQKQSFYPVTYPPSYPLAGPLSVTCNALDLKPELLRVHFEPQTVYNRPELTRLRLELEELA